MVSEQIRKTEENDDEDAVETQDSDASVGSNGNSAATSDNEDSTEGNQQESKVSEGKTLVGSAASRTRMPAIPPPPPPSRPRSELGHKPLTVNPTKTAPATPPPLPSVKASVTPPSATSETEEGSIWSTVSQEVSAIKVEALQEDKSDSESEKPPAHQGVDLLEVDAFEKSSKKDEIELEKHAEPDERDEQSIEISEANSEVALDSLDSDFGLDKDLGERKEPLLNPDNEFKEPKLEAAPETVALPELPADEKRDDTGEMTAVAEPSSPVTKLSDSTATEITSISEDEVDDHGPGAVLKTKEISPGDSDEDSLDNASGAKTDVERSRENDLEKSRDVEPAIDEEPEAKEDLEHSSEEEEKPPTDVEAARSNEGNDEDNDISLSELSLELHSIDFLLTKAVSETAIDSGPSVEELNKEPQNSDSESPAATSLELDVTSPITSDSLDSDLKDLFPAELDSLFPDDFGGTDARSPQDTATESSEPKTGHPDGSTSSDNSLPVVSESDSKVPERRSLSSLVAKGKAEKQTIIPQKPEDTAAVAEIVAGSQPVSGGKLQSIFSQIDLAASTENSDLKTIAEPAEEAFEVGPRPKSEGRSKFASLLSPSLGETVSMRDIMENDTIPEAPAPVIDFASPKSILADSLEPAQTTPAVSDSTAVPAPEISNIKVAEVPHTAQDVTQKEQPAAEPPHLEPPAPEPSPLGADGLPEPWLNLGKKTSDSLQAPKFEETSNVDVTPATGTTSSTRTFNTKAQKSTSDDLHWVSTSDNLKKVTEQDLASWVPNADSKEPKTFAEELTEVDRPVDGTTPGTAISTTNSPNLGTLRRTNSEGWTPAKQERSSTNWDIVPPSDLESSSALKSSTGQNFSQVVQDEFGHDDVLPDNQVTSETAESVFLKGDVTEAARQYHVLIEREENSATPKISQIIQWSESLADLYILMDEPASAVSFYYKARKLAPEPEPRRLQKYLSCLLKLSTRYEEDGNPQEAEKTYLEAIKVAGEELDEKDVLHQRINEAYVRHSKQKSESSSSSHTAAIEEQCSTLRMRAVKGTDKAFSPTKKPTAKEIFEETKLEKADKAERNEKIRRATGTDIEFKAARGLEELSGHPMMRVLNSIWVQVILGVMLIMCGLTCMISLRMTESIAPIPVSVDLKGTYKTAEELKVVEFKDRNKVGIWDEGAISSGTFKAVRGTTDDLLELLRGHLRSKTVFYTLDNDLMQDEDGRALYRPDAPERKIIKQMWWYTGFATWHYKEKHCYQTTTQPWNRVNPKFTYVNPFTGKPTFATITATQGAGNKLLPLVVASGQMYEGEPAPGPGAIRCICFDKVRFFVRGFDRNGKMIQGREPGKAYVIELTDGQNMTEKYMASINVKGKPGQGKVPLRVIVVTDNKELPSMYKSWTTVAPACILVFLFLSVAITVISLVRKKDKLKWYHYLSTSAAVAIAIGWFAIALQS